MILYQETYRYASMLCVPHNQLQQVLGNDRTLCMGVHLTLCYFSNFLIAEFGVSSNNYLSIFPSIQYFMNETFYFCDVITYKIYHGALRHNVSYRWLFSNQYNLYFKRRNAHFEMHVDFDLWSGQIYM